MLLMLVTVYVDGVGLSWASLRSLNCESKLRTCVAYALIQCMMTGGGLAWASLRLLN